MARRKSIESVEEVEKVESVESVEKVETAEEVDAETAHFMAVCPHGVPGGWYCKGCKKTIKIPEDAVIKPKGWNKK